VGARRHAAALVARDVRDRGGHGIRRVELLPLKATFGLDDDVAVEVRGAPAGASVALLHLDRVLAQTKLRQGQRLAAFPPQPRGGYGIELTADGRVLARTAADVLADPLERPRYGFVSDFSAGRDVEAAGEHARRLHLNVVQFYDWMFRHARLAPPRERYEDPLGRPLSLRSVRRLVERFRALGTRSLGYAAVYAVGSEDRAEWQDAGLYKPDGRPWQLGESFLWLVDPADRRWLDHFRAELRGAVAAAGFDGFHLDQYGWPKVAQRADGTPVDVAGAFAKLIRSVRRGVPDARLIFNNVNDFPTWATARAPQDAIYIEVWPPHERLEHLGALILKARALAPQKPVILAAYLSAFASVPEPSALAAARLTMATIFSHGGFHLLNGEDAAVLTDPYYPRHHRLSARGREAMRRWYDFVVRYGDLLFDPDAVDVTRSVAGGINEEVRVTAPVPVSVDPEPGALWVRVVQSPQRTVVHLINLAGQEDTVWDRGKRAVQPLRDVRVALLRTEADQPGLAYADPDLAPALRSLRPRDEEGYSVVTVPRVGAWTTVVAATAPRRPPRRRARASAPR
jgi:dextranase